jgi:hypothetical protein
MIDSGFQDVLKQAKKMLSESPLPELRRLGLDRQGDSVTLSGQLSNYYLKQKAQETIRPATRGVYVRNLIRVESSR